MKQVRISYRGWKKLDDAWVSQPTYYRIQKKSNVVIFGDDSGNKWLVPLADFEAVRGAVGSSCRSCKQRELGIVISVKRRELFLMCEKCGRYHKVMDGKPYLRYDMEAALASLFGGDLGRRV